MCPVNAPPVGERPPQVVVATVLIALEGLAALVFGVLEVGEIRPFRAVVGIGVAILMIGYAVVLLAVARGVLRGRRWSRGPAVATQLILLPVAWSFRGGETTWVAVALAALAAAILVGVLHPRSTAYLVPEEDADPS